MFNKFKSFFYVDIFLDDFKIVYFFLKKYTILIWLLLILILPLFWFFFLIFIFFIFIHIIKYFYIFFLRFFNTYFFKIPQNNITYEYPKTSNLSSFFLVLFIIFYNLPKKISFLLIYEFGKNLQNKFKIKNSLSLLRFLIFNLFFYFLRFLFFFITSYNIKTVKFAVQFLDIFFKNWNFRFNKKNFSFFFFLQQIFIDFINLYDPYISLKLENKRIKFHNSGVIFNPPKDLSKHTLNLIKEKAKINSKDLEALQAHVKFIIDNSQLTTSALRTYDEKDFHENEFLISNSPNYKGEKIFHTSLEFPISNNVSIMVRETTKNKVLIKEYINNEEVKTSYMTTSLKSVGSIDETLVAYKTSIIEANNQDIIRINNTKLLNNIYTGKTNKIDFVTKMLSSVLEPVYSFEKGNIFKDPVYINFHNKVLNDPFYADVRNEYLNNLHGLVKIWSDHFSIFYNLNNSEIVEQVIKFAILDTQFSIDPKFLEDIFNI